MAQQFFEELSRCLRKEQIESYNKEDRRLEIFLHGQPVLSVSPGNEVFLLPAGSKNPEANELYHRVAIAADSAFEYVEAMKNTPLLRARGLENKFHLLAEFGGAVLAGRERAAGQGYEFVTWIWDHEKVGVSHGHYYEDDFAGAKRDFAVRSGLISNASLFSKEELTELYRATEHLLAEDPDLNDKQMKAIQEARTKIEFSVPDLDTQLEHRQDNSKLAYAKLELPASPWELLDALDKARLPEGDSLYLEIIDYHDFEVLRSCHTCSATNLPELNDLAERLSRLDERQHTAFEGLVRVELQKQEPLTLKRLRDLAASADCCHVVESVVSDGQLGRFYAENGFVPEVEGLPDAVFELLDFEKIGEMARTGECGVYVPSGISDLGGYVVQHSDLNSAPEILLCRPVEPDYAIHLRLAARHEDLPFGGTDVVELKLPAEDSVLEMAVRCLGYVDWGEVECTCLDCKVPQLKEHITSAVPFETIKQLGDALTQMPTQWQAVMEPEDCHRLDYALDLSQNLHCYNFLPRDMELADYGKMLAKQDGIYPTDELLVSCFDAEGYANQKMRNLGLSAAEHGYVSWNGIEILYEYSQPPNNPTMSM